MKGTTVRRPVLRYSTFILLLGLGLSFWDREAAWAAPTVVGLWRFNDGIGTNAFDSSGLGNVGTLAGENGNLPGWAPGQPGFGTALVITNDGTNHAYVNIPAADALKIGETASNAWSITAWAYESSGGTGDFVADYGRILVLDGGGVLQVESGASGDAEMYIWSELTTAWQIPLGSGSSVTPVLDTWVHWAVVYDGTNLTVYRDADEGTNAGLLVTPVTAPLAIGGYMGSILIGSELDQDATCTWNGMLDDVAVFAGALSASDVATVMSGDFSGFITAKPLVVSQPQSQTLAQGTAASFTVGAAGQAPLSYQWYFNQTNLLSASANPTATDSTLVVPNLALGQSGTYSVVVTNSLGSVTSQPALLTVFNSTLVALWRFNEGQGTTVLDASGLGNNGSLVGQNGNVPAWVAGQTGFGTALRFTNDGANYPAVVIPANGPLLIGQTPANAWSLTAWAYEDSDGTGDFVATYGRILVIDDGTAFQLESGAVGDAQLYTWARAYTDWQLEWGVGSSVAPLLDQWEHWAVVYDGTNLTVYRDGNAGTNGGVASQPVTQALGGYFGYEDGIVIGTEFAQPASRTWNGMLDDVAVFNIALSQAQVQAVMAGDFRAFIPPPQCSVGRSGPNVVVGWPSNLPTFQLQSTADLVTGTWTNVTSAPVVEGNSLTVTLPTAGGPQFFRISGP